ncbi:GumC family protein [Geomonas anaerohicana]|uniref:Lipopolysaccharide biosynthesis protein n=1 Tax=Geomonas anaerohicana TaxID=2798583 RepID=A0ABS0YC36_9BACT|nr:Wzz/FepE/Etk N-terminal domain-containing protein [Geomonas anaerohicana]MBJ6749684.1 lipopolysaccharide biosynthesis protein [Geomonas anaerohicana]
MEKQHKTEEQEINLLELLHVVVKRKMLIFKICGLAIVTSVIYSLLLPNIYSSTARVLPPQKEGGGGLSALLGQAGGLAAFAASGGVTGGSDLYVGILKSRSVSDAVIRRPDISPGFFGKTQEEARNLVSSAVRIQAGKDGIISITAEDKDAKRSALLANAFVKELGETTVRLNLSKASTERIFLEKRLNMVKNDLQAAEDALKAFSQANKVVQVDAQAKASIEGIARLKGELASKEVQLAVIRTKQTEESPDVKATVSAIKQLKGELEAISGSGGNGGGIPSLGNVPGVSLEYTRKLRELKTQEAVFEQLTKQYEVAKINEAKDSSSFQVLDEAVVPMKKSGPKRSQIVMTSAIVALFISLVAIFIQESMSRMCDDDRKLLESIKRLAFCLK